MAQPPSRDGEEPQGVSRRTFLKTAGVGAAASSLLGATAPPAAAQILGPDAVTLALTVNGVLRTVSVEPRVTLLRVLRNQLDLTGAKEVCDRGGCGACTVLLDGEPVLSCLVPIFQCQGRDVQTVEGIARDPRARAFLERFVAEGGTQCGACTPGIIVTGWRLARDRQSPDREAVRSALAGNLCRCTGYEAIVRALAREPPP